jgi:TolA-binding protein
VRASETANELDTRLAEVLGRLVSSRVTNVAATADQDGSYTLLSQRLERRQRRLRRLSVSAAVAGVLVAGAAGYWLRSGHVRPSEGVITYEVSGGETLPAGDLVAADEGGLGAAVIFSDGTRIELEPRSRGRIISLDRRGGRVALEDGHAHVEVKHRPDTRWIVQAGPFEVRVHGTAFSISWLAADARFDLAMEKGVVSVAGPLPGGEKVLSAGERLSLLLEDRTVRAAPAPTGAGEPTRESGTANAATAVGVPASPRRDASLVAVDHARPSRGWRRDVADGRASSVVAEARRLGLGRVFASVGSEDLAALADAARYQGDVQLARRAFAAQRRRFPRSVRAAEACFLLGRLEDESERGATSSLTWYDRYLAEAPSGVYVSEAMGRKMLVLERAHRGDEAAAIASDYLRRFPAGSYAHAARVLVGAPGQSTRSSAPPLP